MIESLLVCLEGSPGTARATELAIELARTLGARVVGLTLVDEPDITAAQPTGIGGGAYKQERDRALLADAEARAREWLERFSDRCAVARVPAQTLELRGRPAATIVRAMQGHDLTLLGRDANFRFETEEDDAQTRHAILRRAGKPVLIVPEAGNGAGGAIVIAFDGSTASRRALRSFADSGLGRGRALHVVAVADDGGRAWDTAQQGCALLADLGLAATAENVVSLRSIAEAILDRAEKLDAGLVVMGAYVRARVLELLWGSVTEEMVQKTKVPLYLHY
jgi:nucleotide-binding universal stress UspA family protein